MRFDDIKILTLAVIVSFLFAASSLVLGQQEYSGIMNASISQPIQITLSGNMTEGIFFTNTTEIGTQYSITNMTALNNATANYFRNTSIIYNGTEYYVTSSGSNNVNVTTYHCACDHLLCQAGGDCAAGVDKLYVNDTADGGVGWANGTVTDFTDHSPPNSNYYFPDPDTYQEIGIIDVGNNLYLRYWVNPRPDTAPSGTYQTTFRVRAVEKGTSSGTCSC
jgi:hypothetical protein